MSTIHVDIVSATESLYSGEAKRVFVPAKMGEIGVLPKHTPFLSLLRPGEVRVEDVDNKQENIFISGGIVEVQPHTVTVLSDTAIRARDLDEKRALEARQRAQEEMDNASGEQELASTKAALLEAMAQLKMIENIRKRR